MDFFQALESLNGAGDQFQALESLNGAGDQFQALESLNGAGDQHVQDSSLGELYFIPEQDDAAGQKRQSPDSPIDDEVRTNPQARDLGLANGAKSSWEYINDGMNKYLDNPDLFIGSQVKNQVRALFILLHWANARGLIAIMNADSELPIRFGIRSFKVMKPKEFMENIVSMFTTAQGQSMPTINPDQAKFGVPDKLWKGIMGCIEQRLWFRPNPPSSNCWLEACKGNLILVCTPRKR